MSRYDVGQEFMPLVGEIIVATPKAVLLSFEEKKGVIREQWVPRSVIEDGEEVEEGDSEIAVREWFIDKEGL